MDDKHKTIVGLAEQLKQYQNAIGTLDEKSERITTLEIANKRLKDDLKSLTDEYLRLLEKSHSGESKAETELEQEEGKEEPRSESEPVAEEQKPEQEKDEFEAVRPLVDQLVTKLKNCPEHAVSQAVANEFGSLENCVPANGLLEGCLKVLNRLLETVKPPPSLAEVPVQTQGIPQVPQAAVDVTVVPATAKSHDQDVMQRNTQELIEELKGESPPAEKFATPKPKQKSAFVRPPSQSATVEIKRDNRFSCAGAEKAGGRASREEQSEKWRVRNLFMGLATTKGNQKVKFKQVFTPYTKKQAYFDQALQYGGRSM